MCERRDEEGHRRGTMRVTKMVLQVKVLAVRLVTRVQPLEST